jgi:DNA mismatch repair protein MutS
VLSTSRSNPEGKCIRSDVPPRQGDAVFLDEVVPGASGRPHGITLVTRAGLPASVIERAKLALAQLEAGSYLHGAPHH